MPAYEFVCRTCGACFEEQLSISEYTQNPQRVCVYCQSKDTYRGVSETSFILVGDGWPGKDMKCKSQMTARNIRAGQKMKEHREPVKKVLPNVDGQETGTWAEAQRVAKDKGKDASSYDPLVAQEKTRG